MPVYTMTVNLSKSCVYMHAKITRTVRVEQPFAVLKTKDGYVCGLFNFFMRVILFVPGGNKNYVLTTTMKSPTFALNGN